MPQTVSITCRYCGASRDVPAYYAARYATCGRDACKTRRIADRAAAAKAANTGRKQSAEANAKRSAATKGRAHTLEHTAARVASRQANGWFKIADIGERISTGKKAGRKPDNAGEKNPMWRGGMRATEHRRGDSLEYRLWRDGVLSRANFLCQDCGTDKHVIAHHIEHWQDAPDKRTDPSNGKALCRKCHSLAHGFKRAAGRFTKDD